MTSGRGGWVRAGVVAAATVLPAVAVWLLVGWANPPQHDLSDVATGLMQLFFAGLAAVTGLTVALVVTRRRGPD